MMNNKVPKTPSSIIYSFTPLRESGDYNLFTIDDDDSLIVCALLMGMSQGLGDNVSSVVMANTFGRDHVGSIRARRGALERALEEARRDASCSRLQASLVSADSSLTE